VWRRRRRRCTFAWLVVDADGLRLVVAVVVLDAHQVGVGAVVEAGGHGQHVFVGLVHGLHQLAEDRRRGERDELSRPPGGAGGRRDITRSSERSTAKPSFIAPEIMFCPAARIYGSLENRLERERDRQTDRQTDRQGETERNSWHV